MLKHCPFCGKTDTLRVCTKSEVQGKPREPDDCITVVCDYQKGGCGSCCGYRKTKEDAIKLWNTRR